MTDRAKKPHSAVACSRSFTQRMDGVTTVKLDGLQLHLGEPWPVAESFGHGWFPCLARFPGGELLLTYSLAADTNENTFDLSCFQLSSDEGRSWSRRYDCLPEHQPMIYMPQADGGLLALPAHLYTDETDDQYHFFGSATRFDAGGRRVTMELDAIHLVDWPWPVDRLRNPVRPHDRRVDFCFDGNALMVDGRLLATLYGKASQEDLYRVVVASSDDGGYTWRHLATVAGPEIVPAAEPRGHGPAEPALVQLSNGDLMCVMRMGGGEQFHLRRSYSSDGGRTWSTPETIAPYSVEPSMTRLQNGVVVLSTGRPGIGLWVAADERADQWQSVDLLAHHNQWAPDATYTITPKQTTAYTELVEIAPNRILIAYDRTPFGWQPTPGDSGERNRIFLLPVEIQRT
jgi:hypothetical protein